MSCGRCNYGSTCFMDNGCISKAYQRNCEFYTCFENNKNCGLSGYILAYGRKYCYKFINVYSSFTDAGKQWIDCTRTCLTSSLHNSFQAASPAGTGCDAIMKVAFLQHADCYYRCGFCNIWSTNMAAFYKVFDLKDLLLLRSLAQIKSVAYKCFKDDINALISWYRRQYM